MRKLLKIVNDAHESIKRVDRFVLQYIIETVDSNHFFLFRNGDMQTFRLECHLEELDINASNIFLQ